MGYQNSWSPTVVPSLSLQSFHSSLKKIGLNTFVVFLTIQPPVGLQRDSFRPWSELWKWERKMGRPSTIGWQNFFLHIIQPLITQWTPSQTEAPNTIWPDGAIGYNEHWLQWACDNEHVTAKQAEQKLHHDKDVKLRSLFPGTPVMVRDFCGLDKWIPGVVLKKLGPVSYSVENARGRIVKWHIDHLTPRKESPQDATTPSGIQPDSTILDSYQYPTVEETPVPQHLPEPEQSVARCYPQQTRHPPDRFMASDWWTLYLDRGGNVVSRTFICGLRLVRTLSVMMSFLYTC